MVNKLSWDTIFVYMKEFNSARTAILADANKKASLHKLLDNACDIEATIPTYDENKKHTVLPHSAPLARIFGLFGRAFIEERENRMIDTKLALEPLDDDWGMFKSGGGTRTPDFASAVPNVSNVDLTDMDAVMAVLNGEPDTYDTKHHDNNSELVADFSHAHGSKYVSLYVQKNYKGYFYYYCKDDPKKCVRISPPCRTLIQIAKAMGINPDLFNVYGLTQAELESRLEEYFDYKPKK